MQLLSGGLHEAGHVKPREAAEAYFERPTHHEDPKAVFSGLLRLVDFYQSVHRWVEVLITLDRITTEYEIGSFQSRDYNGLRKELIRRIAAQTSR